MDIGTWVAALLTLAIYSFLYKDNPFYRFAEHLLVGVSVGFLIVIAYNDTVIPKIVYPLFTRHDWLIIIPILLGALMFARFFPKISWMSRPAMALYIGFGAGVSIPSVMQSIILAQIKASISPFANIENFGQALNAVLILLGFICVLLYFYFSKKHEGIVGVGAKIGIYFLMIFFGATFGFTVMARISLLIGRAGFLLRDWLHIIKIG
jgi:hypothetical protein